MRGILASIFVIVLLASCGGDSPSSPSPVTAPPIAPAPSMDPELTSSDVKITRTVYGYHYISWKFTIDSPKAYDYAYVVIRWYDEDGFQVEWSNWAGNLKKGIHEYTDETMVRRDIWSTVTRRRVTLESWR